jgi:hypothetical protein
VTSGKVITLILSLITLVGAAFSVDGFYLRKAAAAEMYTQQIVSQERDRIDVELQVIRLELDFLSAQYSDVTMGEGAKEELRERKQYLRKRAEILEARQLALRDKQ